MPTMINVLAFRMQSADLATTVNVGQTVSTGRGSFIKRQHGYGVNTGNYAAVPSAGLLQDMDVFDSLVFMPITPIRQISSD